ncbi:hypothetical protein FSOLCH5_013660 [Fusarium solani]|jgi:sugar porter (SP) family MFS transporter|uniref:General substrate transporter n=1 Tax=Fusarium solani TaxID=169388 RepID=A0A9P9JVC7_FUSSL|nr:general substrate transporter [Fusarium solani]KAH7230264.1 general substrate transporter [Fusarium solani]
MEAQTILVNIEDMERGAWYKTPHLVRLYLLLLAPLVTITAWGFDLSMTNSLQALDGFNDRFGSPSGSQLGLYGASTQVGGLISVLFVPFVIDRYGRRLPCFVGSTIVVAMALMQTFSTSFNMFVGSKLVLGFGAFIALISAPTLITELAHPAQRTTITAIYNTLIYVGLIIGAWVAYGARDLPGNASWQIPCGLQAVLPAYQVCAIWFCPESPRWLIMRGRVEEAKRVLVKYHGGGHETPLVERELLEIIQGIEADRTNLRFKRADLKSHFTHRGNLHRLLICTVIAVGSQCLGSGLVSAYLPAILDQVGLQSTREKTLINGIINIWSWIVGMTSSLLMPRFRRRVVFLTCTSLMIVVFSVWTALAAMYVRTEQRNYGIGVVVSIFLFNTFYGASWLPLNVAYPLEIVTTKQRGVYFSWTLFVISGSSFAVNYINPIGLESLSWRYYIITIAFNCLVLGIIYFTFIETKDLSLEQIAVKFDKDLAGVLAGDPDAALKLDKLDIADAVCLERTERNK